jgi:hypothetical protein
MATISLAVGVASAFTVATGVLAAPGAALGLLAALFAVGGLSATRQRLVAGTGNAVLGLLVGLAALVAGVGAVTGALPWLDDATNNVTRLHHWLDAHAAWVLPKF